MFSKNCLDLDNTPVQRAPGIIWDPPKKDMLCIKGVTKNQTGGGGSKKYVLDPPIWFFSGIAH